MLENFDLNKFKNIHMIGIGGISMSGIAEILYNWGYTVTGTDSCASEITNKLNENGIKVHIGHNEDYLNGADLVVYSAAIREDNPELILARKNNILTIERGSFVGEITKMYNNTIGISGTHGKTTTTSMVSLCFIEAGLDPSIQVGAILKQLNGNYRVGNSGHFILEACEYVDSFLKFWPKVEIILNIDNDHLDYFKDLEHIKDSFKKYVAKLPTDGLLVINADDLSCTQVSKSTNAKVVTYGLKGNANFIAKNITFDDNGFAEFEVFYNDNFFEKIKLSVPGIHNISNALACIALCNEHSISKEAIKNALLSFTGAHRRFEYVGKCNGASVYNDYGHHPTEIKATIDAVKNRKYNKSWVVFQPHTYSRTFNLLEDFAKVLKEFDNIIIIDIYAAREINTYGISSLDLVNKIKSYGKDALYIPDLNDVPEYIKDNASNGDIVLALGAGNIIDICEKLID